MTLFTHWPIYSISTHVSISIFILLIKQLFSKKISKSQISCKGKQGNKV